MRLVISLIGVLSVGAAIFVACGKDDTPAFTVCSDPSVSEFSSRCGVDYVDVSDATGDATVIFGGTVGFAFEPSCLRVKAGQNIRIDGDFSLHPLTAGCGPVQASGLPVTGGTSQTLRLDQSGTYGFYCANHGLPNGQNMVITVDVVP